MNDKTKSKEQLRQEVEQLHKQVSELEAVEQKRKQAEETLLTMAEMFDIAPSSITVHDFEGRFLYANHKTFELHGYDEREFMALNLSEVDCPESAALIAERMAAIVKHGEATFPVRHFRKDGTAFPLEVYVKQVVWRGIPVMLSVATDITERKRAEEARDALIAELQEALEQIKTLRGIIPICAQCKKIRDDKGYWNQVEVYVRDHTEAEFSHGMCPECIRKLYPEDADKILGST